MTQPTFVNHEGHIFYNGSLLIYKSDEKHHVISAEIRGLVKSEHQAELDDILFDYRATGESCEYRSDLSSLFNVQNQLKKFNDYELEDRDSFNKKYSLGLTEEELVCRETFEAAKARYDAHRESIHQKISNRFKAPVLPYTPMEPLDLKEIFGKDDAKLVKSWIKGEVSSISFKPKQHLTVQNVLRLTDDTVENLSGYHVRRSIAQNMIKHCLAYWRDPLTVKQTHNISIDGQRQTMGIAHDHVVVGCQTVHRAEVERIAARLNLI